MERNLLQELKVGLFVMGFIGLIAVAAFVLGGGTEAFKPRYKLHAAYVDVKGLKPGAIVRLAGIDVGEVSRVDLAPKTADGKNVHVELTIREDYQATITTDSVAGISSVGVLGDNIITISPGTPGTNPLTDGASIESQEALDFVDYADRASAIVESTASISKKVDLMLGSDDEAKAAKIADSLAHVEAMLKEAKEGQGVLHVLFYDEAAGRKVKSVLASADMVAADVADMTREIRTGDGLAHAVIYGDGGDALAAELGEFAGEATGLVRDIKTQDSLLHAVLYDPSKARMLEDAAASVTATRSILESVNNGEGSAGLLVKDPQLYEDLRALLGGAQRNALLRAYARSTIAHARAEDGGAWVAPQPTPETGGK